MAILSEHDLAELFGELRFRPVSAQGERMRNYGWNVIRAEVLLDRGCSVVLSAYGGLSSRDFTGWQICFGPGVPLDLIATACATTQRLYAGLPAPPPPWEVAATTALGT
ncbi:MAG TPA: hypothetical protein VH912_04135 [Streptosporangiaceae bacterium]|jgi:hypothetical protein